MTTKQAVRRLESLKKEIKTDCQRAVRRVMNDAKRRAVKDSSGGYSPKRLAQLDHPYAKRHGPFGSGLLDPARINSQTGEFRAAWGVSLPESSDRGVTGRLFNMDDKADFIQYGTEFMVVRPIKERLELYIFDAATYELNRVAKGLERIYG